MSAVCLLLFHDSFTLISILHFVALHFSHSGVCFSNTTVRKKVNSKKKKKYKIHQYLFFCVCAHFGCCVSVSAVVISLTLQFVHCGPSGLLFMSSCPSASCSLAHSGTYSINSPQPINLEPLLTCRYSGTFQHKLWLDSFIVQSAYRIVALKKSYE